MDEPYTQRHDSPVTHAFAVNIVSPLRETCGTEHEIISKIGNFLPSCTYIHPRNARLKSVPHKFVIFQDENKSRSWVDDEAHFRRGVSSPGVSNQRLINDHGRHRVGALTQPQVTSPN